MPARNFARYQGLKRVRREVEEDLTASLTRSFRALWRRVYPRIRELRKAAGYDPLDQIFTDFDQSFEVDFEASLIEATQKISGIETRWWDQAGFKVGFIPELLVREYWDKIGALIGMGKNPALRISDSTRNLTREAIDWWYADPDRTLQELAERMEQWYSPRRARLIAVTETTGLVSIVTRDGMKQAGLTKWTWQTRLEWNVCPYCEDHHGKTYGINDPFPPEGSHPGCYCFPAPVIELYEDADAPLVVVEDVYA